MYVKRKWTNIQKLAFQEMIHSGKRHKFINDKETVEGRGIFFFFVKMKRQIPPTRVENSWIIDMLNGQFPLHFTISHTERT